MPLLSTSASVTPASPALEAYASARAAAIAQFSANHRIQALWRALTKATDTLLTHVATDAEITLIAVGGYGRSEMFPFSDIDVLVLVPEGMDASRDAAVVATLQQLWDMQITVGHATRTIEQTIAAANSDSTITAALMDARYICGHRPAYLALKKQLRKHVFGQRPRDFVAAKLSERDRRHSKWGDSRFMLEPNIKEGKGGLRDLHTLTWLARYCYHINKASELVRSDLLTAQEWRHYRDAYLFFSTVRAYVHTLRNRADERLTFDLQLQIAGLLSFPGKTAQERAEKFMLRYFKFTREVGSLTRIFCSVLEEENLRTPTAPFSQKALPRGVTREFKVESGRLNFAPSVDLSKQPVMAIALFDVAQQSGLDIHPRAHLSITRALPTLERQLSFEGPANARFLELLLSSKAPEITLRRMNETGVLGALIPEFGRIAGMMQYDGYHTYTVDEHTIVAIGNLAAIENGELEKEMPLSTVIAQDVTDRAPLYLAMLCHDIAKGSGGAHAEKGEAMAERIGERMGLTAAQGQLAGWLVKHHLLFSEIAFKRDIDDAKTIEDFVSVVQSPERLRLLLLLTVADIKAVGPTIWNRWKGALIRDLYHRAMVLMGVGFGQFTPQQTVQEHLLREVPEQVQHAAREFMEDRLPASWWYRPREEQISNLTAYAGWRADTNHPSLVITHDRYRAISEITCAMAHTPETFRLLAGVMAWIGASIVTARSMITRSGAMVAMFGIQDAEGNSFAAEPERLTPITELIAKALAGELDFATELPRRRVVSRGREVTIEPSVFIDNKISAAASVIEVNARDRIGLLYDILGALAECQLQVITAHIATYGKKAVDVFYVKDAFGIKLMHPAKLEHVQQTLLKGV